MWSIVAAFALEPWETTWVLARTSAHQAAEDCADPPPELRTLLEPMMILGNRLYALDQAAWHSSDLLLQHDVERQVVGYLTGDTVDGDIPIHWVAGEGDDLRSVYFAHWSTRSQSLTWPDPYRTPGSPSTSQPLPPEPDP